MKKWAFFHLLLRSLPNSNPASLLHTFLFQMSSGGRRVEVGFAGLHMSLREAKGIVSIVANEGMKAGEICIGLENEAAAAAAAAEEMEKNVSWLRVRAKRPPRRERQCWQALAPAPV